MSKEMSIVSDVTGKPVTTHVMITIHKPDNGFVLGGNTFFGPTTLDVDESELPDLLKNITFVSNGADRMKSLLQAEAVAQETFVSPGDQKKV